MEVVVETAKRVANASTPVLIEGESGTGKELIARLIHSSSDGTGPFVPLNCGAIPESLFESELFGYRAGAFTGAIRDKPGIFEAARDGTLFLDEIGELTLSMQAKLLRALQEREIRRVGDTNVSTVKVRIIAATNKDLEKEIKKGKFREDLFYRISVVRIYLEPLRKRPEDVLLLCEHFATKYSAQFGRQTIRFSDAAIEALCSYHWPGNIRELENEIQRLVLFSDDGNPILPRDLSSKIRSALLSQAEESRMTLKQMLKLYERQIITEALERHNWNKTRAAKSLGLTRQGLYNKLRHLGIEQSESG